MYSKFFCELAHHLCLQKAEYIKCFEKQFEDEFKIIYRLKEMELHNAAQFFAHLLENDIIAWDVCINI